MKFIWITEFFLSASLALRMRYLEKQDVKVVVTNKNYHKILEGMIEKEDNYEKFKGQGNIFITADDAANGKLADELRKSGEKVYGGNAISDRLENERSFGQQVLKAQGLKVVDSQNFKGPDAFEKAKELVAKGGRWCFKQNGDQDKSYSHVGKFENGDDMLDHLSDMKKVWTDNIDFDLQKFIKGHEVGVSGVFNGKEFLRDSDGEDFFVVNWEHKKKSVADLGSTTGEVCTLQCRAENGSLLVSELKKIAPYLKKIGYIGNVDINFIIDEETAIPHPLEFTNRFGFPAVHMDEAMMITPFHEFLSRTVSGENDFLEYDPAWCVVIVVSVPPFPFHSSKAESNAKGQRIYFLKDGEWSGKDNLPSSKLKNLHPYEVKYDKVNKHYLCAGDDGYLIAVTDSGSTVGEANARCLERLKDFVFTGNMDYRTDCGINDRVQSAISFMQEHGFL